jgi:hypothetical protein
MMAEGLGASDTCRGRAWNCGDAERLDELDSNVAKFCCLVIVESNVIMLAAKLD